MDEYAKELIGKLPKVEQHIHVVGSIRPETLSWLVSDNDAAPSQLKDPEKAKALFEYRDFNHFIECYTMVMRSIRKATQFERIIYEMLEDEAKQNVKYVEASFSAPDHTRMGLDYFEMMKALDRGIGKARHDFGIWCNLKIDLVRDYGPEAGMGQLDLISSYRENVVAIDIGGREHVLPARSFAPVYERAKKMGLHLTAHSGEASSPESIWEAVGYLQVERIGHGVSAREDPSLMDYLLKRNISIEMCPVSNVKTKIISDIKDHPIKLFFDRGMNVTVNSDDPTMFGTNMNNEYQTIHEHLGFTLEKLFSIGINGIESSFLESDEKSRLQEMFSKEFEKLVE